MATLPKDFDFKSVLLHNEVDLFPAKQIEIAFFNDKGAIKSENGRCWITNYRLFCVLYELGEIEIPYSNIVSVSKVVKSGKYDIINVHCRDMRIEYLGFKTISKIVKDVTKTLSKFVNPKGLKTLTCFVAGKQKYSQDGWETFKIEEEFKRQKIDSKIWRCQQANEQFQVCISYPQKFVVPIQVSDTDLLSISQIRAKGRVPALCWTSQSQGKLLRCSAMNFIEGGGTFLEVQPREDELFIEYLLDMCKDNGIVRFVEVGKENDNKMEFEKAPYSDCQQSYCGIANHQDLFSSIKQLVSLCQASEMPENAQSWFQSLNQTRWLQNVESVLQPVTEQATNILVAGETVVVQSKDGANVCSAVVTLIQMLIEPYYRTIKGFAVLIEKDFLSFGHRFGNFFGKKPKFDDCYSTIFLLTLDCIWQMMQQNQTAFEFNEHLLVFLMDAVNNCRFGTFTFVCERDRVGNNAKSKTTSVWSYVFEHAKTHFTNILYEEQKGLLPVRPQINYLSLWNSYFLRHKCRALSRKANKMIATAMSKKDFPKLEMISLKLPLFPISFLGGQANNLKSLKILDLSDNLLNQFPAELSTLPLLEEVNFSSNQISFMSKGLVVLFAKNVPNLRVLNLTKNRLQTIPQDITKIKTLQKLLLGGNALSKLPYLTEFAQLAELDLSSNSLVDLAPEIMTMTTLTSLNVEKNSLANFPMGLSKLQKLAHLMLAGNKLKDLPPEISSIAANLQTLTIGNNQMSFTADICKLKNLRRLDVSRMNLTELPTELCDLPLEELNVSHNGLTGKMSDNFLKFTNLRVLNMEHNEIEGLPLDISMLSNLEELTLQNNKLYGISPGVGKLQNLRLLNVENNNILHIPAVIGYLKRLQESKQFLFKGNTKLKTPPKNIRTKGYHAIFEYLKALLDGYKRCYRTKVMVVGQENVGKTSLLRCLTKNTHIDKELKKATNLDSVSTDGIDIGKFSVEGSFPEEDEEGRETGRYENHKVAISVWDFAGQEIYYTTHQFFLSERAVYILVWNMATSEENSRVEYWLKSIEARAPNCPIIIVGTHLDDPSCTKEYVADLITAMENKYFDRFPNIQAVVPISCSNQKGVPELLLWLQAVVLNQPQMGEKIPTTYLELEKLIYTEGRLLQPPTKTLTEFEDMGHMINIRTREQLLSASTLLHSLGSIIHFQKEKLLEDLVILDPQWLVDIMSTVITTKHHFSKNGILLHQNLPQIWRPPRFPSHLHETLLFLLEKFEISHFLRSTKTTDDCYSGKSLIPSLLPEDRPSGLEQKFPRFPKANENQFGRNYKFAFIPHGFVSRLMVRLLHFAEPTIFWRFGMLVEKDEQKILIETLVAKKMVNITLRGPGTGQLSQLIIETINALVDGWYKVNVDTLVPCIHCVRKSMYDPFIFTLQDCEQAAIDGETYVKCGGVRPIRLDLLAPDVAMSHMGHIRLDYNDIEMGKKIGEGGYADVHKSVFNGTVVAVKKIKFGGSTEASLDDTNELEAFGEFRREVWIMSGLVHQNCVQLTGFTMDPICIVTEFLNYGDLYGRIHDDDVNWTSGLIWRVAHDMAKGMAFLHGTSPPIIHRDLKSPNVLMASINEKDEVLAKIADFGLSQALASTAMGRSVANPVWLAPEIMKNEDYTEKADVYSFGVMLWELWTQKDFFGEVKFMSALENKIIEGERPPIPNDCPEEYASLIKSSWASSPDDRLGFSDLSAKLLEGIEKYHPELVAVAKKEKSPEELRPPRKKTKAAIEEEERRKREEAELKKQEEEAARLELEQLEKSRIVLSPQLESSIQKMVYVPHAQQIWSGCSDGSISVWDAKEGKHLKKLTSHSKRISSMLVVNDTVWTSSEDSITKIWSFVKGLKVKKELKGYLLSMCQVGTKFVWGGTTDTYIQLMDIKSCKAKKKIKVADHMPIFCMLYLEVLNTVWAGLDGRIARINVRNNKLIDIREGHQKQINDMILVGSQVWTASHDKTIRLWNAESGDCIKLLQGHSGQVFSLLRTEHHVWSASWDKAIIAWDAQYKSLHKEYQQHQDAVSSLAYAKCTDRVWSGSWDKSICAWKML